MFLIAILALVCAVYLFWNFVMVAPNTHFATNNLSGMTNAQAENFVKEQVDSFASQELTFIVGDKTTQMSLLDLGIELDAQASADKIAKSRSLGFFSNKVITPKYSVDFARFKNTIDADVAGDDKQAKDAQIVYRAGKFQIVQEEAGTVIDKSLLIEDLKTRLSSLSTKPIVISKIKDDPEIDSEGAHDALTKVNNLGAKKIVLTFGQERWEIAGAKLIDILRFYPEGRENVHFAAIDLAAGNLVVQTVKLKDSANLKLTLTVDRDGLGQSLSVIAKSIDSPTVDATAKFEGGRVVEFTPAREGRKLDVDKAALLVSQKLSEEDPSATFTVELPVSVTPAKIANREINELGIRELVGRGVSYYAGSIPNRIHNLSLGSSRISGTIVKPGDVFSFNQTVGEVSGATGYKQAYVIQKGRTVLDDGGGICQVSTTVFRAALNSGLPIVTRTAHAYRVGYYEQRGFKAGLDATVWSPSVDFQFKNDTQNHILVQAVVDSANAKLQVDIYGTSDGRRVEMTDPVVSNIRPAPEPLYQDDPTLPKGTTKQVDFAAAGATSAFSRKVYKGDKLIIDDTFKSNFKPWQAVFLVGTGG